MTLYIVNPKESTKKLLELINKLSRNAGYKINTQKSIVFLYTCTEQSCNWTVSFSFKMLRNKFNKRIAKHTELKLKKT